MQSKCYILSVCKEVDMVRANGILKFFTWFETYSEHHNSRRDNCREEFQYTWTQRRRYDGNYTYYYTETLFRDTMMSNNPGCIDVGKRSICLLHPADKMINYLQSRSSSRSNMKDGVQEDYDATEKLFLRYVLIGSKNFLVRNKLQLPLI